MLKVAIREPVIHDIPFILNSFLKSLGNQRPYNTIDKNIFNASFHMLGERILKYNMTLIACQEDDPTQIYGWITGEPVRRILYFVYVKNIFRQVGVGTNLMKAMFNNIGGDAPNVKCAIWTSSIGWQEKKWGLIEDTYPLVEISKK